MSSVALDPRLQSPPIHSHRTRPAGRHCSRAKSLGEPLQAARPSSLAANRLAAITLAPPNLGGNGAVSKYVAGANETTLARQRSIGSELWESWRGNRALERVGYAAGALLIASGLVHFAILAFSGGSWEGPASLRKAVTFGFSFGVTLVTIVWVTSWLTLGDRTRRALLGAFIVACVLETLLVSLQAWRGVPSHFNIETTFDGLVARALAAGGVALIAIIVSLTFASLRAQPAIPASLRIAIRIGFVMLCSSLAVGALMIAKGMALVFAGHPQAAYATGGWLKPTHAVTMHAILVLPALARLLSFADWPERRRLRVVLAAAGVYVMLVAIVAAENLAGRL